VAEPTGRLAGTGVLAASRLHRATQNPIQTLVVGQTQHVTDLILLTPTHDRLATEPGVPADHDTRLRPARADLLDDPLEFFNAA
jgi:hypothetical protein